MKKSLRIKIKNKIGLIGEFRLTSWDRFTGRIISQSPIMRNRIVSGTGGYGRNIVMRQLTGDTTYPIAVNSAGIGTGTNTPTDSDTALQTPVLTGISIANTTLSNDSAVFSIYITNATLANNTYKEFALYCTGRLFARALISPTFTKGSNQNTTVDYTITLSAA